MDTNQNTEPDFYIKKTEDENQREYNVFFVNKDVPLSDEILQEMAKYEIVEFCDSFNQPVELGDILSPTDNLPSGVKSLTISKNYRKPLDNLPISIEIIRY